ncbi:sugar ABC transporter substrate-binding protein [Butyricicoccus faecihominis]|uniref:sugar ABC transporter substrate-binding protein n=1 Tax=Butyricicoccaceae TaxID=3085642 RepID=UPI00247A3FDF|nr:MULTISPECIES: sugar ABC transporter substrate-binding protein [Butyricicoccaceae]MCQ5129293.1 sugar ABC transporter substrate-binding protein [Butyricicoccus faecihominis]WNX85009.1 sugar ABC transporter substrate-binding protein [Agathobaculum sp. NTUH-O15-33]
MKTMKKHLALAMSGVLLAGVLAGCGGGSDTPAPTDTADPAAPEASGGGKDISVIVMALNSDYWHMVEAGAKIAGKELGYNINVVGPNAETDSAAQINMVEDACNNKAAAIVLAANEPTALVSAAETVKSKGIPLVLIDTKLNTEDDSLYECFVGTGNVAAGKTAGEYIASKLQKGDKVAIIRGTVGQTVHDDRVSGAQEAMEAAGLEVVSVQPADSDRGKGMNVAENIIQSTPDIKAFYCTNDEMALGATEAVKGARLESQTIVMGFDGSFGALDSIQAGELTASLAQQPIEEGYQGVKNAVEILEGKSVEKNQAVDVLVVDSSNVDSFYADVNDKMAQSGVKRES